MNQIYGQTEIGMMACNNKEHKSGTVEGQSSSFICEDNEIVTESDFPIVSCYYKEDGTKDFLAKANRDVEYRQ